MKVVTLASLLWRRFVHGNEEAGLHLLNRFGRALVPSYRFVFPQIGWWWNEGFNNYLRRFGELEGMNSDRHWTLYQLCRLTQQVAGDTAECGVYRGASSYLLCVAGTAAARTHHVFDSFQGLSEPGQRDGSHWRRGALACPIDEVRANLDRFERVHYYPGWIPERFAEVESRRFSFVHVDVDLEQPTRDSLHFFYPRTNPGGIILCDDYGFTNCPGVTATADEFFADKPEKMLALSGGGGFMIKGCPVGPDYQDLGR